MFLLLLSFVCGVALMSLVSISEELTLLLFLVSFFLALVWRRTDSRNTFVLGLCVLGLALGFYRMDVASDRFGSSELEEVVGNSVELEGVVVREPAYTERTVQLYLGVGDDVILVSTDSSHTVQYGDGVTVVGTLERPSSFVSDYGREFDYPGYLRARGVEYRVSFADIEVTQGGLGNPFIGTLLSAKAWFMEQLELVIPEPQVGLGKGLLLGVDGSLGNEIEDDFRRTGIIHIVVLSGYNVMLVVAFTLFILSFLLPFRWRIAVGFLSIVAFALIVGLSATVVRASIMASLVLFAELIGRRYDVLRALVFAGALMVLVNPHILMYDIGFQLSFMATLGLILITPHFEERFVNAKQSKWKFSDFLFATIATQIAVLPLLAYHIGEVSLIAVVVNVIVLPLVPLAMFLTFATGILAGVSLTLGTLVGFFTTLVLSLILGVAHWFAVLPFAAVILPPIPAWSVLALYVAMGWVLWWWKTRVRDEFAGWTIETETAGSRSEPAAEEDDVPIFFR